jgi:excisionase family DNA binding protein
MQQETAKLLLKPSEAFELLGISRSKGYALLASGEIRSIRIGRSIRVPVTALKEYIERKLTEQSVNAA